MTRESFLNDIAWLDMLKLRATYGITGNVDQSSSPYLLGAYANLSLYTQASITLITTPLIRCCVGKKRPRLSV